VSDPFDIFTGADHPVDPRAEFAAELRNHLAGLLGLPTVSLPARKLTVTTTTTLTTTTTTNVTPYLTVHNGAAALTFYEEAFDAVTAMRVIVDEATGQLGHAEFRIGDAKFYLSDEFVAMGVVSPRTLGGTSVAMHVEVADVDATFAKAVASGATTISEPGDQPEGARRGTLLDPFGHRWMLSQTVEVVSDETFGERMREQGAVVVGSSLGSVAAATDQPTPSGGIWAALNFADAPRGIRFMIEVLGFTDDLVVTGADPSIVEHSQLRWPEGGIVQAGTANRLGNVYSNRPIGAESLYVITADPMGVYRRCVAAGTEVLATPISPDYDPDGLVFSIRDHEGNIWSFGTYAG
jgi:PhnB protein